MARRKIVNDPLQLSFDLWGYDQEPVPNGDGDVAADIVVAPSEPSAARPAVDEPAPVSTPRPPQTSSTSTRSTSTRRIAVGVRLSELVQRIVAEGRAASMDEQRELAEWPGWGATPEIFDDLDQRFASERDRLRAVWTDQEWASARRTVLNAHYTAPEYAAAIWDAVAAAGFTAGAVLEPGCGSGTFISTAPAGAAMTGIELDPTTALATGLAYPKARVLIESFADTTIDHDGFDAAVGNVPFGKVALYDPEYNPGKLSIHNHFILKSLRLVKPGGIVAVLTSRFTLDAKDDTARRAIAEHGALVGAVRLPTGAHVDVAGTDVITDLLIFRRHLPDDTTQFEPTWLSAHEVELPGGTVRVNDYFDAHPDHVLGTMTARSGRFGPEVAVTATATDPATVATHLRAVATAITAAAATDGHGWAATGHIVTDRPTTAARGGHDHPVGHLGRDADGTLWAQGVSGRVPVQATPRVTAELRRLLGVRDAAVDLLSKEAATISASTSDSSLTQERERLNAAYDSYVAVHGAISRTTTKKSTRVDEDGEPIMRRIYPPAIQLLRGDPHFATVAALEHYDDETETASKAAIFRGRVIGAVAAAAAAQTPQDAIAISVDRLGRVDLDYIAALLELDIDTAVARLEGLVFLDPAISAEDESPYPGGRDLFVTRAEYLSGDVRRKLRIARAIAKERPEFQGNVAALKAVQPVELGPAEIDVSPNAGWLPNPVISQWLEAVTGKSVLAERIAGTWKIRIPGRVSPAIEQKFSTDQVSVHQVLTKVLNGDDLKVTREIKSGETTKRIVDPEATAALVEVAESTVEHFQDWIWRDPDRADHLQRRYNDLFNGIVLRSYDGVQLTLPGLSNDFTPRPHQHAAVARMIAEPSTGLFHEVGAGKTAEMVMGVMELKRLGMIAKPAIIVPNNMLDQFTREFKQLYPAARVLAAGGGDVARSGDHDGRRVLVARAATSDWDAVIITQNAFTRIGLGADTEREYVLARKLEFEMQLTAMRASVLSKDTVKSVETKIARHEERLKALTAITRDTDGVSFEETGIDYLCVDEAHGYKNLAVETSVADLQKTKGSQKATDLDMKLWLLRDQRGQARVCTMATATPIANSMIEMYVMQRYMRPDLLMAANVYSADDWAAQFTRQVPAVEQSVAGEFRMVTRTAAFRNIPELLKMWHTAADVKTQADLNLPVPVIRARDDDGQHLPEVVSVPATEHQRRLIDDLLRRAEAVRNGLVTPQEDNMLKISSDGRTIAMDARLVDESLTPTPGEETKIGTAAAPRIAQIWRDHRQTEFLGADGRSSATRGALQIVFADRGTPSHHWNAYEALKAALVHEGMPETAVRFIHDAASDDEKAALFKACRDGRVSVIVGSTERMGTGTNIQARAIALHHLDCPWRPADVTQRDGRIVRQHNQNPEVQIIRYVTKGSFDGYMWQTVTRKAKFIEQVLAGRLDVREMEDIGETTLSFAEVAAIAADDMRILEKAQLEAEVTKLKRSGRAFDRGQTAARVRVASVDARVDHLTRASDAAHAIAITRIETRGDAFTSTISGRGLRYGIEGTTITDRREFGEHAITVLRAATEYAQVSRYNPGPVPLRVNLSIGGIALQADVRDTSAVNNGRTATVHIAGVRDVRVEIAVDELNRTDPLALAQRIERRVTGLDAQIQQWNAEADDLVRSRDELQLILDTPWAKKAELTEKASRLDQLVRELAGDRTDAEPSPAPTGAPRRGAIDAIGSGPERNPRAI